MKVYEDKAAHRIPSLVASNARGIPYGLSSGMSEMQNAFIDLSNLVTFILGTSNFLEKRLGKFGLEGAREKTNIKNFWGFRK